MLIWYQRWDRKSEEKKGYTATCGGVASDANGQRYKKNSLWWQKILRCLIFPWGPYVKYIKKTSDLLFNFIDRRSLYSKSHRISSLWKALSWFRAINGWEGFKSARTLPALVGPQRHWERRADESPRALTSSCPTKCHWFMLSLINSDKNALRPTN